MIQRHLDISVFGTSMLVYNGFGTNGDKMHWTEAKGEKLHAEPGVLVLEKSKLPRPAKKKIIL